MAGHIQEPFVAEPVLARPTEPDNDPKVEPVAPPLGKYTRLALFLQELFEERLVDEFFWFQFQQERPFDVVVKEHHQVAYTILLLRRPKDRPLVSTP